jgi:hypothetical protein
VYHLLLILLFPSVGFLTFVFDTVFIIVYLLNSLRGIGARKLYLAKRKRAISSAYTNS